jgi:L-2-hydroxyglutarate oxidase LhgO
VIHAGVYYEKNSMKARFCSKGNVTIYEYCKSHNVSHFNTGKFIVACTQNEIDYLNKIYIEAKESGVKGVQKVTKSYLEKEEPLINCIEALYVPTTGIVDQNALMRSYLGELEDNGGSIAYNSTFQGSEFKNDRFFTSVKTNNEEIEIQSNILINAAGLQAENVAKKIHPLTHEKIPKTYFAKGNYFETSKNLNIKHLIYPVPNEASLGLHLGLDIGMKVRFGPDVEWVDEINYEVDIGRLDHFYQDIKKYLPSIDKSILKPGYSGIRPKLKKKGEGKSDFIIQEPKDHGINNLINLYGIESPGLTSSLVLADYVFDLIN